MDEVTLKIAQIEKVRDRITRYLGKTLDGLEDDLPVDAILNTVAEYFNDLTGDTQPVDLETLKPCETPKGKPIKKGDEIAVDYEVRLQKHMRLVFRHDYPGWTPEIIIDLLNNGQLVRDATSSVVALSIGDVVVADIFSDETLCGTDYNSARDFSLALSSFVGQLDPSDDEHSLQVGDPCPNLSCGGRLGQAMEDGTGENQFVCPECGLIFGTI